MVSARALLLLAAMLLAPAAGAQGRGIQVSPVLISVSPERPISSLRLRNGRPRAAAFEIDAYAWRQEGGEDILTPTDDLIVAPGVFEVAADGEQTVRIGVRGAASETERSYRIVMREIPPVRQGGVVLGLALEMSLPIFVTPADARAQLTSQALGDELVLRNAGRAHVQLAAVENMQGARMDAPRYLLAGASAEIALPAGAQSVRVRMGDVATGPSERIIDVRDRAPPSHR